MGYPDVFHVLNTLCKSLYIVDLKGKCIKIFYQSILCHIVILHNLLFISKNSF